MTYGFKNDKRNFVGQVVESKADKPSIYNGLAEEMYFLDKSSQSNLNFLDFPLLV